MLSTESFTDAFPCCGSAFSLVTALKVPIKGIDWFEVAQLSGLLLVQFSKPAFGICCAGLWIVKAKIKPSA